MATHRGHSRNYFRCDSPTRLARVRRVFSVLTLIEIAEFESCTMPTPGTPNESKGKGRVPLTRAMAIGDMEQKQVPAQAPTQTLIRSTKHDENEDPNLNSGKQDVRINKSKTAAVDGRYATRAHHTNLPNARARGTMAKPPRAQAGASPQANDSDHLVKETQPVDCLSGDESVDAAYAPTETATELATEPDVLIQWLENQYATTTHSPKCWASLTSTPDTSSVRPKVEVQGFQCNPWFAIVVWLLSAVAFMWFVIEVKLYRALWMFRIIAGAFAGLIGSADDADVMSLWVNALAYVHSWICNLEPKPQTIFTRSTTLIDGQGWRAYSKCTLAEQSPETRCAARAVGQLEDTRQEAMATTKLVFGTDPQNRPEIECASDASTVLKTDVGTPDAAPPDATTPDAERVEAASHQPRSLKRRTKRTTKGETSSARHNTGILSMASTPLPSSNRRTRSSASGRIGLRVGPLRGSPNPHHYVDRTQCGSTKQVEDRPMHKSVRRTGFSKSRVRQLVGRPARRLEPRNGWPRCAQRLGRSRLSSSIKVLELVYVNHTPIQENPWMQLVLVIVVLLEARLIHHMLVCTKISNVAGRIRSDTTKDLGTKRGS
ncbi:hypothetical protein DFH07DRAFT_765801 [Mycena maculata]|uniref:Uncharacterized protein n=1 Tax=Mycena maculata TaxID=230809 RepID=A0AAD7K980_9AGAR|nr:hypothetical protein DFH07DRAFT_765801 [Mycena maculata]